MAGLILLGLGLSVLGIILVVNRMQQRPQGALEWFLLLAIVFTSVFLLLTSVSAARYIAREQANISRQVDQIMYDLETPAAQRTCVWYGKFERCWNRGEQ